jgi:hypothetical protein
MYLIVAFSECDKNVHQVDMYLLIAGHCCSKYLSTFTIGELFDMSIAIALIVRNYPALL